VGPDFVCLLRKCSPPKLSPNSAQRVLCLDHTSVSSLPEISWCGETSDNHLVHGRYCTKHVTFTKDILQRLSITWNCNCCNYTGSFFCPTRIVCHFIDYFAWRDVALPSPLLEFTVSCVPRRLHRWIAVVLDFSRHITVGRWTGLIQCLQLIVGSYPFTRIWRIFWNFFSAHGCDSRLPNTLFIRHRTEDITSWVLSSQIVCVMDLADKEATFRWLFLHQNNA